MHPPQQPPYPPPPRGSWWSRLSSFQQIAISFSITLVVLVGGVMTFLVVNVAREQASTNAPTLIAQLREAGYECDVISAFRNYSTCTGAHALYFANQADLNEVGGFAPRGSIVAQFDDGKDVRLEFPTWEVYCLDEACADAGRRLGWDES